MTQRPRPVPALAIVLVTAGLALGGCGSGGSSGSTSSSGLGSDASASTSSGSSSAGVAHARAQVKQYSGPTGVPDAGPPLKGVASLKGKKIWFVPQSTEIPYFAAVVDGAKAAAAAAGLDIQVCDGQNTPATMSACIDQARTGVGTGVIGDGIEVGQVQQSVNALEAKHIPYVQADLTQQAGNDKIAYAWNNSFLQSVLAADAIIADSNGKANILIVRHTDSSATQAFMDQGGAHELAKYCPGCQTTTIQTSAVHLSKLTSDVSAALVRNPNVNYVFAEFDLDVPSVVSALQSLNKDLPVYSTTAQLSGLQRIKSGDHQAGDAGTDPAYMGWAAIDQLMRMMLGTKPNTKVPMPVRLFTKDNVSSLQLTNAAFGSGAWYGASGFQQMFKHLWGE